MKTNFIKKPQWAFKQTCLYTVLLAGLGSYAAAADKIAEPKVADIASQAVAQETKLEPPVKADEPYLPKAENIKLDQPIEKPIAELVKPSKAPDDTKEQKTEPEVKDLSQTKDTPAERDSKNTEIITKPIKQDSSAETDTFPFVLLGTEVPAGTSTRLAWSPSQSFEGLAASTPVLVVNGKKPGPVLCLTAAVHGDELNGIEIVRRVLYDIDPDDLSGTVIGVPIVNLQGFQRTSRYLTDRRDLNRYFPGNPDGSSASRIAHSFFNEVVSSCSTLVDLHTGSFHRTNLPQLRADLHNPAVLALSQDLGATVVLHSSGAKGTLRYAASMAGIPTVTLEAGEPMRVQEKEVAHGVKAIQTLLNKLEMLKRSSFWGKPEPVFYESTWVRANHGGILFSSVYVGKKVKKGDKLGTVTDPITNVREEIISPTKGRILGMALNQVVMPGFAAFRIGIETTESDINLESTTDDPDGVDSAKANTATPKKIIDDKSTAIIDKEAAE